MSIESWLNEVKNIFIKNYIYLDVERTIFNRTFAYLNKIFDIQQVSILVKFNAIQFRRFNVRSWSVV